MAKKNNNSRRASRAYMRGLYRANGNLSQRRRFKRSRRARRSINFWFYVDDLTYTKVQIRDVERVWLQTFQPQTRITKIKVAGCEKMPRYQQGLWDGQAYQLKFETKEKAMAFRLVWWNQKII